MCNVNLLCRESRFHQHFVNLMVEFPDEMAERFAVRDRSSRPHQVLREPVTSIVSPKHRFVTIADCRPQACGFRHFQVEIVMQAIE